MLAREQVIQVRPETGGAAGLRGLTPQVTCGPERLAAPEGAAALDRLALALLRAEYARLVAAARASVAAARAGEANPLVYVEAELVRHCGLPPQGSKVTGVLADAGTAMVLADRATRPYEPVGAAA
jgi:hypothetical protein